MDNTLQYIDTTDLAKKIEELIESDYNVIEGATLRLYEQHLMTLIIDVLGKDAFPNYWILQVKENDDESPNQNRWVFMNDTGNENIITYNLSEPYLTLERIMGCHEGDPDDPECEEESMVRQHIEDCLSQQSHELAHEILKLREYSQTAEWQEWAEETIK